MTSLQTDKMKLSVLVVSFLLLVSAFTFLPAVGAISPTTVANTGSSPAAVVGATAVIDYPILAGYSVSVTRTITLTNPIGNTAISSFTISIPKAAVGSGTPSGAVVGGSPGATAAVYGTGPWAIVYTGAGTPPVLAPGGSAITLTVTFTTETTYASTSGVADPYTLSASVTDTTGASTTLASITVYETTSTTVTVTGPTGSVTAGTPFTVKASGTDSGLPLVVTASGSLSNKHGVSATTTLSPSTFTTGPNTGSQSISVNDTTAETLGVSVTGGTALATSSGGILADSYVNNANALTINAGAVTSVAVAITFSTVRFTPTGANTIINLTNSWGLNPIKGQDSTPDNNNITVSTADKYGNPAPFGSATSVTLSAITTAGQTAGFSTTASAFGSSYPYTPTGGVSPSLKVNIGALQTSVVLNTTDYYFFGVDYGSSSYLLASANTLTSGKSAVINTYTLNAAAVTLMASTIAPKAGTTVTINATISGTQQAGVPINFANTTATVGRFSNGLASINTTTTVTSGGVEVAAVTFTPSTVAGASVIITGKDALPGTNGIFAYNTAAVTPVTLTTSGGSISKLVVLTSLSPYVANAGSPTATTVTTKGSLYVAIMTADAYGNPSAVSANTQIQLSSTGGLSATLLEIANTYKDTVNSTLALSWPSGLSTSIFTPTTGSSFTITATATVNGVPLTGTTTISVVSATPLLTASGPSTLTTGVPSTISGTANASTGLASNQITTITYSVNGGSAVSVGFTPAANVAFSFTVLLTKASAINITVTDSHSNTNFYIVNVPPIPATQSFTYPAAPVQTTLSSYKAIAVNVSNAQPTKLTAVVFVSLTNSAGQTAGIFTSTVNSLAPGTSTIAYVVLNGLASGTYTATIFVLSTSGVPLSQTTTVSVTI
ncbi:MAG: hypothetical protein JRN20_03220 [Nitrososphaerota archaeon]|nr:hypothetical protein [Nitrososphaerota archaeon]MDG6924075.1 hypothetical protein [Nitrososphaerota archaeon]